MFKNLCKNILNQSKVRFTNNKNINYFSTKLNPQQKKLQDWQYVQEISKQIKNNDINQALKHFIQSHLNKQILNKQIFYSFQEKMQELSIPLTYHEILYKLYRQHFQPNSITTDWMKKISNTQNPCLIDLLKKDFLLLNQQFPDKSKKNIQDKKTNISSQKKSIQQDQNNHQNNHKFHVGRKSRKVPTATSTDQYFSKTPEAILVTKRAKNQSAPILMDKAIDKAADQQEVQAQSIQHIQSIIAGMFKQYEKITLHDVQFTIDQNQQYDDEQQQMNQMYNQNFDNQGEENDQQQQTMEDYVLHMLSSISKVKIGRIQLRNPNFLQQISKTIKDPTKNDNSKN